MEALCGGNARRRMDKKKLEGGFKVKNFLGKRRT